MSIHEAALEGNLEECQRLIGKGVDVNLKDTKGRTALHLAAWKGNAEIVKCLLAAKCNTAQLAQDGFTALHFAALRGNAECIKLLVEKQRSLLTARVSKGNKTALHLAVVRGDIDIVKCLLDLGSDVCAKTGAGKLAFEISENQEIYMLLKEKYESVIAAKKLKAAQLEAKQSEILEIPSEAHTVPYSSSLEFDTGLVQVKASEMKSESLIVNDIVDINRGKKRKIIMAHLENDDE